MMPATYSKMNITIPTTAIMSPEFKAVGNKGFVGSMAEFFRVRKQRYESKSKLRNFRTALFFLIKCVSLQRVSLIRPAPSELPQDRNVARVGG